MKKYLIIIILIALIFTSLFSIGCEKQKIKNGIIKFDEEYWEITDELIDKQKAWTDEIDIMIANLEKDNENPDDVGVKGLLEMIRINEAEKKYYLEYMLEFKNLTIPEPLKEFYLKKIEQCDVNLEKYNNWTEILNFAISEIQNLEQEQSSILGHGEKLAGEHNDLNQKRFDLDLECRQIIENVYLEYDLDDLIDKWQ